MFSNGQPDLGGGALGSIGNNRFLGHIPGASWALSNASAMDISARYNYWGFTTTSDIEGIIWDQKDSAAVGRVCYDGYLTH